jgi:hypothetical protein
MFVPSLMTLGMASVAFFLSINSKEEIVKVAMASVALICLVLALVFAPWIVKLVIMAIPLILEKMNYWSV